MKIARLTTSGIGEAMTANLVVFGAEINQVLLAQAVRVYRANERQGTSKVKTRAEINRTKKKWFKQKGTGNARHGARTPNIFVGGGVSHGPTGIQNWSLTLTKSMKQKALQSALAAQVENSFVMEDFDAKTKNAVLRKMIGLARKKAEKVMVVLPRLTSPITLALRNMSRVTLVSAGRLTALEVAQTDLVVFTEAAVAVLEKRLGQKNDKKPKIIVKTQAKTQAKTEAKAAVKVKKTAASKDAVKAPAKKVAKTATKKAAPKKTKAAK